VKRTPDRLNTAVLSLVALVLVGAGAYGLARGYDAFGPRRAVDAVLGDGVREFVAANEDWFWPVAAAVSLFVAWLGFRWLVAQVRTPAVSRLRVGGDPHRGTTELSAPGAAAALAGDIETYAGVRSAGARVVAGGAEPAVDVIIDVHDDADVAAVRTRVEEHALPRLASALEVPHLRARVHLRLAEASPRVVR
jgi:hypothetical protein